MAQQFEMDLSGRRLIIETGKVAGQAAGAVTVRYGDTLVLATAVASSAPRPGTDFFPLTIDYEERLYAAGKIPGSRFIKREGRPTDEAILTCRLIDRPLRPLFPKGFRNDVQVVITTLSADQENSPDILGIIGASAAVSISDIPFSGPVGAVRVGFVDGELIINPTESQLEQSQLDLTVAGTKHAVLMVESGSHPLPEAVVLDAIKFGHESIVELCELQERLVQAVGKPKKEFALHKVADETKAYALEFLGARLSDAVNIADKATREKALDDLKSELLASRPEALPSDLNETFDSALKTVYRNQVLEKNLRSDGRDTRTVRPITCEVGILPRTHGSGLFTRGQTQALTIATLGSGSDEQILRGLGDEEKKRYIHHYNMPGFASGEVKRVGSPGRREIGHGALAERALLSVIPPHDQFPYTIRVVSEILSSNGSTSMASVCGSTLALMDAGVPILAPVAGVAMGLITGENGTFAVLTDILGMEDALGDMDFKVAGTHDGITALQMDLKAQGLSFDIMEEALEHARIGRLHILDKMTAVISTARTELSPFAPRITSIKINPEKIGTVIGPGGKMIRKITEESGATVDIQDDGTINVASVTGSAAEKAIAMIRALVEEIEVGKVYQGTVKRIMDFGAFVEVLPGKEGLVRNNHLSDQMVERAEDVVKVGDTLPVKVLEVDQQGRVNLSHRATIEGAGPAPEMPRPRFNDGPRPPFRGGDNRGGFRGGDNRGGFRGGDGGFRGGPPRGGFGAPQGSTTEVPQGTQSEE